MAFENLLVETREGLALVTVNRPAKLNALDARTIEELAALRATLEAVNGGLDRPLGEAQEGEAALFGDVVATADAREGTRAFLEKRAPRFEGR